MYTSGSECLPTVSARALLSVHGPSCAGPTGFMHPHPGACAGRERQGRGHRGPGQSLAVRALAGARSPSRAQKQPHHYFKHMGFIRKLVHRCKDWTSQQEEVPQTCVSAGSSCPTSQGCMVGWGTWCCSDPGGAAAAAAVPLPIPSIPPSHGVFFRALVTQQLVHLFLSVS